MSTYNVELDEHFNQFVEAQISGGHFRDAAEVLRAGLMLLEQQKAERERKLEELRAAAKIGFDQLDRGEGIELNGEQGIREFFAQINARVDQRIQQSQSREAS